MPNRDLPNSRTTIPQVTRSERMPLSRSQRGLWLLDRLHPGTPAYNVPFIAQLHGDLDVVALCRAINSVIMRHEVLRTTFVTVDGAPVQRIATSSSVDLSVIDLSHLPAAQRKEGCQKIVFSESVKPFDLATGPLVRAFLVRLSERDHVFGVVLHHIICDGASMRIMFDEFADCYAPGESTHIDNPQSLPLQFADFAAWQLQNPIAQKELDWWRQYLAGAPTVLDLPGDHARPPVRSMHGASRTYQLPAEIVATAAAVARQNRTSTFMVMLGAYATLLGRLCGVRDLLVGTPIAGREFPELEELLGYFVTTVPVRIDLSGSPTFLEVLGRIRRSTLGVLSHQEVSFETLVEMLRLDRNLSHTPLVQAFFTFEGEPLAQPRFVGLTADVTMASTATAKFDLDFMIVPAASADRVDYELIINYSTDIFSHENIDVLAGRFLALVSALTEEPETPVWRVPFLSPDETRSLREWQGGLDCWPTDLLVHELVEARCAETPNAIAVSTDGRTLTYRQLLIQARHVALQLNEMSLGPDDVVGLLLPQGLERPAALLGILMAGCAYLPLDPHQKTSQINATLQRAGAVAVVSLMSLQPILLGTGVPVVLADDGGQDAPHDARGLARFPRPRPGNLAYLIFTSGSTGEPKGVAITHAALVNHAQFMRDRYRLTADDRVLQFSTISFDVAAEEMFPTLLAGGCVVTGPDPVPPPTGLTSVLAAGRVSVANLPASYWHQWIRSLDAAPADLRLLIVGSETVDKQALSRWLKVTDIPLINAYGLTETTITSTLFYVDHEEIGTIVPVGRPIDGMRAYVLDSELGPVPPGQAGELYLGGIGLARGYHARPDLTADRFVPDPFADTDGQRMHRTGDRACWRRDGVLEIIGRTDDQIKIRGYRIEPGQIEAAALTHPDVAQAVVAAKPDGAGGQRLVGYVAARSGAIVPANLRQFLTDRLPAYMIPSAFVAMSAMPTTPNGKMDRAALPTPELGVPAPQSHTLPRTPTETHVYDIWQKVLRVGSFGVDDNFFDLGGNSFALAAVHADLAGVYADRIPMVTLYEYPTVSSLAAHLDGNDNETTDDSLSQSDRLIRGRARLAERRRAAR